MRETSALRIIGYSSAAAVAASFVVLLIGMCLFGFQFAYWAEREGRVVGVVGTIAGIVGAAIGLMMGFRAERRAVK